MRYCVSGGHLEFSHLGSFPQVFTVTFFSLPIVYFISITTSVILLVLQIPHFWAPIYLAILWSNIIVGDPGRGAVPGVHKT